MKSILLTAGAVLLLSGCATTQRYSATVNTWVGHDQNNLIAAWGPPSRTYVMPNGQTMLTWSRSKQVQRHAPVIAHGPMGSRVVGTTPNGSSTVRCDTTFTINQRGLVSRVAFDGNGCR